MAEKPGTSDSSNLSISTSSGKEDKSSDKKKLQKYVKVGPLSPKKYKCTYCKEVYDDERNGKKHERFHKLAYSVTCSCGKKFYESKRLKKHAKTEHVQDEPFKCSYCASRFGNIQDYGQHLLDNHREEYDKICKSSLPDLGESSGESSTRKRLSSSTDDNQSPVKLSKPGPSREKLFRCFTCKISFIRGNELENHMSKCHPSAVGSSQCIECDFTFSDGNKLKEHTINTHLPRSSDEYQCCICVFYTKSLADLQQHRKTKHQLFHQCGDCINVYLSDAEFTQHVIHHSLTRSLRCPCNVPCSDLVLFKKHCLEHHSDSEPFRCASCPTTYDCILELESHTKMKHGAFVCSVCQQTFDTELELLNHSCTNR